MLFAVAFVCRNSKCFSNLSIEFEGNLIIVDNRLSKHCINEL